MSLTKRIYYIVAKHNGMAAVKAILSSEGHQMSMTML